MPLLSTFVVPPKLIQDTYLVREDWNTLQDNEQAILDALGYYHVTSSDGEGVLAFGEHATNAIIPRSVLRTSQTFSADFQVASTSVAERITGVSQVSTGRYLVELVDGVEDPDAATCFATAAAAATQTPRDVLTNYVPPANGTPAYYEVTCLEWDTASSSWELADFAFTLTANHWDPFA